VTPVLLDAGDDNHTNARLRTRNYSFCICNSGIARFAGFAIDSFDGALATSALTIYSREQDGSHCTVTTLGFTIVWQNLNSEHPNEQLAKTNIIKACIVNESDGLVHLDKNESDGLVHLDLLIFISKINKKTKQQFDFTEN